mmetsp:Transcript_57255/g.181113  ORF Transcript_57255/g.181113 Transcript_57255/m.181113 type:complete len:214 (-) Transcript_57255:480-1121(-)
MMSRLCCALSASTSRSLSAVSSSWRCRHFCSSSCISACFFFRNSVVALCTCFSMLIWSRSILHSRSSESTLVFCILRTHEASASSSLALYLVSIAVLALRFFSCSLSSLSTCFFCTISLSCSIFSSLSCCLSSFTLAVAFFSRAIVSAMSRSACSSSSTCRVRCSKLPSSSSPRSVASSICRWLRSLPILSMLSATLGFSLRLRHSCLVVLRS